MRRLFLLIAFLLTALPGAFAQEATPEMADKLRADGKIWVVVLVLATIFAGIIVYLISLDRKIRRIEKDQRHS